MSFLVNVSLPRPWDMTYTYTIDKEVDVGAIVYVDLNGRKTWGIVRSIRLIDQDVVVIKYKGVLKVGPSLNTGIMSWLLSESEYNFLPYGIFVDMILRKDILETPKVNVEITDKCINANLDLEQHDAINELKNERVALLRGATGSGKTEVYFELISDILSSCGQVLILLPEISLTKDWQARFKNRFGFKPYIWHSKVSKKNKDQIWNWAISGAAGVVVGARSTVFLPLNNLRLIVIDEEHDYSYKQDSMPRYHARDVALRRIEFCNSQIILASATPSLETLYQVKLGNCKLVDLKRMSAHGLPNLKIHQAGNPLSDDLVTLIQENAKNQQGSLLLVNRRGYATLAACGKCKRKLMCGSCSVPLAWHSTGLNCHWCGKRPNWPNACLCGVTKWSPVGWGLERVYDWLKGRCPDLRIGYVSSDVSAASEVLEQLRAKELDLVIGTQIISQGHNIKNVSLVAMLDIPEIGDFRAREKLYQLITQTRGRAGRGGKDDPIGTAWWETDNTQNTVARLIDAPHEFYENELEMRKKANMPPFSFLVAIIISAYDNAEAKALALKIAAKKSPEFQLWGPAAAPLVKIRNMYRWRILIRGEHKKIAELIKSAYKENGKVKVKVEIDPSPYNFY